MITTKAYGSLSATEPLVPMNIQRRDPLDDDVVIETLYCGICHSDIHTARDEWPGTVYPCVPGHEIVGRVAQVGKSVKSFNVGDLVGVGCMVDSCGQCTYCKAGIEHKCVGDNQVIWTYQSPDLRSEFGGVTHGGYSKSIVVKDSFVLRMPENMPLAQSAPLLCAGITSYSPLKKWNVGQGTRVGIAGFGGIGDVAVRIAKAMGAQVTVMTRSIHKKGAAISAGADDVIDMTDADAVASAFRSFDFILSTVPKTHDVNPYLSTLDVDGVCVLIGCVEVLQTPVDARHLIFGNSSMAGSGIGSIRETQEMLDFCANHNVQPNVEIISPEQINDAYDAMATGAVDHRHLIDISKMTN